MNSPAYIHRPKQLSRAAKKELAKRGLRFEPNNNNPLLECHRMVKEATRGEAL